MDDTRTQSQRDAEMMRLHASDEKVIEIAEFVGQSKQRFRFLEDEAEEARAAREEFIPRIKTMEKAVLELTTQAIPKLTQLVERVGEELSAQREERKEQRIREEERVAIRSERTRVLKKAAAWFGGIVSAAIAAVVASRLGA